MSFCTNCGAELTEGAAFCSSCGAGQIRQLYTPERTAIPTEAVAGTTETVAQETEAAESVAVYQQPVYYQSENPPVTVLTGAAKIFSIISMVGGIASILLCRISPHFGIAAIVLSILGRKKTPTGIKNAWATVGLITGIIGVSLAVIIGIISSISGVIEGIGGFQDSFHYPLY